MTTLGNIQVFFAENYTEPPSISQICLSHKVFLMHLHSSYDKAAILLPPFSIYCEQAFVYFNL